MAANTGMVAGSHNRNEFVTIRHDGDAPAPVSLPSVSRPAASCRSANLSVPFLFVTAPHPHAARVREVLTDLVRRWI
jgi:hypothetical protein